MTSHQRSKAREGPPDWNRYDEVTPGLKAIIGRCLQFEPDDRYQRADELQMDLQREQQNLSLVNTTEPTTWAIRKWTRRHPRTVWAGLVGAFLLAIVIPLANAAMSLKRSNDVLNSQTAFEQFSNESNEFLSAMMADPNRQKDQNITNGMAILERHGFLQRNTIEKHLAVFEGAEKYRGARHHAPPFRASRFPGGRTSFSDTVDRSNGCKQF